jgi:hypothetical protein
MSPISGLLSKRRLVTKLLGLGLVGTSVHRISNVKPPNVHERFVGGLADLRELFRASAKWRGISREEADEVSRLVPAQILELGCFLDRLSSEWRYDYGEPFALPGGQNLLFGVNTYNEVDRLFDVLHCARSRLDADRLPNYLLRLADPINHQNFLSEFAPILRVDPSVKVEHEVTGFSEGNNTIDWLIRSEPVPLLLEVKKRIKDVIEAFVRIQCGEKDPDGTAPAPMHDPSLLFTSVESKFVKRSPSQMIQGVWVATTLQQEESELQAAFAKLDPSRVHLAMLGDWADDVYVLTNDTKARESVLEILHLRESRRAVFRRGTN